ncbi:MAG TPA: hypothetical protein VFT64_04840 [Rickettsiales bacterium]|nr:hypothetical protein [Rickettsiales bacterium]
MQKPSSESSKAKRFGMKLFRFGTVFSAFTVVMSLFSGLGTQLANKLTGAEQAPTAEQADNKGLLPYETPSFHVFDSVFVNEAKAVFVNVAT